MRWKDLRQEWRRDIRRRELFEREFPYAVIADELVALRARLGLTQSELAAKVGMSQSVIARAESGRHPINARTLTRIATSVGFRWRPAFESIDAPTQEKPVRMIDIPVPSFVAEATRPQLVVLSRRRVTNVWQYGLVA